jgi:hypothetical protein
MLDNNSWFNIIVYKARQITFETHFNFAPGNLATLLFGMFGDTRQSSCGKSRISYIQYSLNNSFLDHCVLSNLSRRENGVYDKTDSECEFLC